jgi:hypothetical protein
LVSIVSVTVSGGLSTFETSWTFGAAESSSRKKSQKTLNSLLTNEIIHSPNAVPTTMISHAKPSKLRRTDVCDLVMVVSFQILQCHFQSIVKHPKYFSKATNFVINDDEEFDSTRSGMPNSTLFYHPNLIATLQNLTTTAAVNSISLQGGNSGNQASQRRMYCGRMEYMIASWILMIQETSRSIVDIRLSSYALSKIADCLDAKDIKSHNSRSLAELKYDVPLPIPSLPRKIKPDTIAEPSASRKRKKTTHPTTSHSPGLIELSSSIIQHHSTTFAGMYDDEDTNVTEMATTKMTAKKSVSSIFATRVSNVSVDRPIQHELSSDEQLVLFLRAMCCDREKFWLHLICIGESLCNTNTYFCDPGIAPSHTQVPPVFETLSSTVESTSASSGRKRRNIDTANKSKLKKQKLIPGTMAGASQTDYEQSLPLTCR